MQTTAYALGLELTKHATAGPAAATITVPAAAAAAKQPLWFRIGKHPAAMLGGLGAAYGINRGFTSPRSKEPGVDATAQGAIGAAVGGGLGALVARALK